MENCKTELRWTLFFFFNEIPCAHHCSHFRDPFAKREVLLVGRGWNRVPRRKVFMIYYMEEVLIRIVRGISIFYGGQGSRVDGRLGETSLIPPRGNRCPTDSLLRVFRVHTFSSENTGKRYVIYEGLASPRCFVHVTTDAKLERRRVEG